MINVMAEQNSNVNEKSGKLVSVKMSPTLNAILTLIIAMLVIWILLSVYDVNDSKLMYILIGSGVITAPSIYSIFKLTTK